MTEAQTAPHHGVSATTPDWSREHKALFEWSPARSLLAAIRSYQHHRRGSGPWHGLCRRIAVLRHRFWQVVAGSDIPINAQLGGGLMLPHPNGIVIHPDAVVGPNCLLFHQVTLGTNGTGKAPTLGGHVDVGAGARILGGVVIGDHARIGANAVVLCDVPAGATAIGVPAKVLPAQG